MCHNILLENRLNQKNSSTIFESLILNNQWDILLRMFKLNILNINITDCKGRNALYYAILNNRLEVISTLAELNINKFVSPNFLAINFAVYLDNTKALSALKKCGFDLNMVDEINSSAIIYACLYKKQKSIEFLLKNGADINHEDFMGNCAKKFLLKKV